MAEDTANVEQFSPQRIAQARSRVAPLTFLRFIPNEPRIDNPVQLDPPEVQSKCFAVLGYLEEYYGSSERSVPEIKLGEGKGLQSLERQLDNMLSLKKPQQDHTDVNNSQHRELIKKKLSDLLAFPQVRGLFEQEFNAEFARYQAARGPMREVRDIDRVTAKLRQAIYRKYLDSKKQHGKLTQSIASQIGLFQGKLDELEVQKRGIEETASPSTVGYLETQKLLDYKRELKEKGFVTTPSREHLIDRITREALAGKKIFLVGSTGTGKTQLAFYVLNNITKGYELVNWHEGTTPRDLFGYRELWTDESGNVQSGMKPGPIPKALENRVGVIHEEYTGGSTRTQLAAKFMMGARPGDKIQIPGFNGQVFDVTNNFIELFTGNPKDERTKQREDMDPAILRELTGVEVNYMPAYEMNDIIRAMLIEENGVLKLSVSEAEYVERLTKAAEMMQRIHNRDFDGFPPEMKSLLGIDAQGNTETTLNTNFLDPGTLFKLFSEWELASARGQKFDDYMSAKLGEFIADPKTLSAPEERKTLQKVLHAFGLITNSTSDIQVTIENQEKGYILPSEMAGNAVLSNENPMDRRNGREPIAVEIETARELFGERFFGPEQIKDTWDIDLFPKQIPDIGKYLAERGMTEEHLKRAAELDFRFELRIDTAKDGSLLTMEKMEKDMQTKFDGTSKGKILHTNSPFDWYIKIPKEAFFESKHPKFQWALVSDKVIPETQNKNYLEQTEVLINYLKSSFFDGQRLPDRYQQAVDEFETQKAKIAGLMTDATWAKAAEQLSELSINQIVRHTPSEVIYDMIMAAWKNPDRRYLPDMWTWTNERTRDGHLVNVGDAYANGARVDGDDPRDRYSLLGASLSL